MKNNNSIYPYLSTPAPRYLLRMVILDNLFKKYIDGTHQRFMEIGPGLGDVFHYLLNRPNISHGVALDFSPASASLITQRLQTEKEYQILCQDLMEYSSEKVFDYTLLFEVLEHIDDDLAFMKKINAITTKGGLLFLSVPAYMKNWQHQDEFSGHVRRYEKNELRNLLKSSGFEIIEFLDYGFPLMTLLKPVKQIYYCLHNDPEKTTRQKTQQSGVNKRQMKYKKILFTLFFLKPFTWMQSIFSNKSMGDGLIVVARKS